MRQTDSVEVLEGFRRTRVPNPTRTRLNNREGTYRMEEEHQQSSEAHAGELLGTQKATLCLQGR